MRWGTTEQKDNHKMSVIIWCSVLGVALLICSGFFTWWMSVASVYRATYTRDATSGAVNDIGVGKFIPLGILGIFVGACMGVGGTFYGLWIVYNEKKGPRKVIHHARILARFGVDSEGRMHTDESQLEFLDNIKYYVRVLSPTEGSIEYQCQEPVFYACGEGMMGDAEIQGKWLGSFRPYIGMQETHVGQKF